LTTALNTRPALNGQRLIVDDSEARDDARDERYRREGVAEEHGDARERLVDLGVHRRGVRVLRGVCVVALCHGACSKRDEAYSRGALACAHSWAVRC